MAKLHETANIEQGMSHCRPTSPVPVTGPVELRHHQDKGKHVSRECVAPEPALGMVRAGLEQISILPLHRPHSKHSHSSHVPNCMTSDTDVLLNASCRHLGPFYPRPCRVPGFSLHATPRSPTTSAKSLSLARSPPGCHGGAAARTVAATGASASHFWGLRIPPGPAAPGLRGAGTLSLDGGLDAESPPPHSFRPRTSRTS